MRRVYTCPEFKIIKKSSSIENNLHIISENSENFEKKIKIDTNCELSEFGCNTIRKIRFKIYDNNTIQITFLHKYSCIISIKHLKIVYSIHESYIIFTLNNKNLIDDVANF